MIAYNIRSSMCYSMFSSMFLSFPTSLDHCYNLKYKILTTCMIITVNIVLNSYTNLFIAQNIEAKNQNSL